MIRLTVFLIFFSLSSFSQTKKEICNTVVKTAAKVAMLQVETFSRVIDYFSPKRSCEDSTRPQDMIIHAIESGDKEKFNKALEKLEKQYILQVLAKLAPDRGSKKGETELDAFKRFLNEKFDVLNSRLSKNEKTLLKKFPIKTLFVLYQYEKALNHIKVKDPQMDKILKINNGKGDAIRHTFINALAARYGMDHFVKAFSTLREQSSGYTKYDEEKWKNFNKKDFKKFNGYNFKLLLTCNPKVPADYLEKQEHEKMLDRMIINRMDVHNNGVGINIGKNNPCDSTAEIYKKVKEKYKQRELKEVVNAGRRCFDVSSNYDREIVQNDEENCLHLYSYANLKYEVKMPTKQGNYYSCSR